VAEANAEEAEFYLSKELAAKRGWTKMYGDLSLKV